MAPPDAPTLRSMLSQANVDIGNRSALHRLLAALIEASSGGNVAVGSELVWRPGGTAADGVYVSWSTLYAAIQTVEGLVDVVVDTTSGAATIPSGAWDLSGVTLVGFSNAGALNVVSLADGAVLTGLRGVRNFLDLVGLSTGAAHIVLSGSAPFFLVQQNSRVRADAAGPVFSVTTGPLAPATILLEKSTLGDSANAAANVTAGDSLRIVADDFSTIETDSVSTADVGAEVTLNYAYGCNLPAGFAAFAGSIFRSSQPRTPDRVVYLATNGNDDTGDGSSEKPLRTIAGAIAQAVFLTTENLTIRLNPGQYTGAVLLGAAPIERITIEGVGEPDQVVLTNNAGTVVDVSPDVGFEDNVRLVALRNLTLDGDNCLVAADATVGTTFFLSEGLVLENVILLGDTSCVDGAKVNRIRWRDVTANNLILLQNTAAGTIDNLRSTDDFSLVYDTDLPLPATPREQIQVRASRFIDVSAEEMPWVFFDQACVAESDVIFAAGEPIGAPPGIGMIAEWKGTVQDASTNNFDDPVVAPQFSFDGATIQDELNIGAVVEPTTPYEVFARNASIGGDIGVGVGLILNLRNSEYDPDLIAVGTGVGTTGWVDQSVVRGAIPAGAGPDAILFSNAFPNDVPLPPGRPYTVAVEPDAVQPFSVTAKTELGFTLTKGGAFSGTFAAIRA